MPLVTIVDGTVELRAYACVNKSDYHTRNPGAQSPGMIHGEVTAEVIY